MSSPENTVSNTSRYFEDLFPGISEKRLGESSTNYAYASAVLTAPTPHFTPEISANKTQTIGEIFAANPLGLARSILFLGFADVTYQGLWLALYHQLPNMALQTSATVVIPIVILCAGAILNYQLRLNEFKQKNGREPDPIERRVIFKQTIDTSWVMLAGTIAFVGIFLFIDYGLPVILSALGWTIGAGWMHLINAILIGLVPAITITATTYALQRKTGNVNKKELAIIFFSSLLTGMAWYFVSIAVPRIILEPLAYLAKPALTALMVFTGVAANFILTAFFSYVIPKIIVPGIEKITAAVPTFVYQAVDKMLSLMASLFFTPSVLAVPKTLLTSTAVPDPLPPAAAATTPA